MEHIHDIDDVLVVLNELREGPALQAIDLFAHVQHTTSTAVNINFQVGEGDVDGEAVKEEAKKALRLFVSGGPESVTSSDSLQQQNSAALLSPLATHVGGSIKRGTSSASSSIEEKEATAVVEGGKSAEDMGSSWCLSLTVTHRYLELSEVGPMIDGDLVIQGHILEKDIVPILCVVDYAADHDEDLNQGVCFVAPWEMMINEGPGGNSDANNDNEVVTQFTIPIKVEEDNYHDGSVRVNIFVGKKDEFNRLYSEKEESFLDSSNLSGIINSSRVSSLEQKSVLATTLTTPSRRGGDTLEPSEGAEAPIILGKKAIVDVKVIFEDNQEYERLKDSGYVEAPMIDINESSADEAVGGGGGAEFHVLYRCGDNSEGVPEEGNVISNLEFVSQPKDATTNMDEAVGSDGKEARYESCDLSKREYSEAVKLKWNVSSTPDSDGFDSLALLVSSMTSIENAEGAVDTYLSGIDRRHTFARLPEGTRFTQSGDSTLLVQGFLLHNASSNSTGNDESGSCVVEGVNSSSSLPEEEKIDEVAMNEDESVEDGIAPASSDPLGEYSEDDEDEEDDDVDEELVAEQLEKKVSDLSSKESTFTLANSNLQKQCVTLIARERASSNNAAMSSSKRGMSAAGENGSAGATVDNNTEGSTSGGDRNAEKESSLNSVLTGITSSRIKIAQQMADYDQLSHDLQTRLDDREFKATEISESFAAFKREILAKAENTRTNRPLSNRLVKQFAKAQAARDEDLERVRLRNISMRRQLARLEKQLRAREQLAEGLHMIDFEQLKVENQTLYEKIEERTEELTKLKRKKNNTVQVLTHVREKLRCIENNNHALNNHLSGVENETMSKRGGLTGTKKDRDLVREDNKELRRKQGFSSSTGLLTDFEKRVKALGDMKARISELSDKYNMLAVQVQRDTALVTSVGNPGTRQNEAQFPFPPGNNDATMDEREGASGSKTPFFPGAIPDNA